MAVDRRVMAAVKGKAEIVVDSNPSEAKLKVGRQKFSAQLDAAVHLPVAVVAIGYWTKENRPAPTTVALGVLSPRKQA